MGLLTLRDLLHNPQSPALTGANYCRELRPQSEMIRVYPFTRHAGSTFIPGQYLSGATAAVWSLKEAEGLLQSIMLVRQLVLSVPPPTFDLQSSLLTFLLPDVVKFSLCHLVSLLCS